VVPGADYPGAEYPGVVDDVDRAQDREASQRPTSQWNTIFAYQTPRIVRILDWKLGCIYWCIVLLVVMYVLVVNFAIQGKHQESMPGAGVVILRVKAKAFAGDKVFDTLDIRWPEIEPTGGFFLTKQIAMKGQVYGNCVDFDRPKRCPCDRAKGETCASTGDYCIVPGWCPSLGDSNAESPPPGAEIMRLEGLESVVLSFKAGITFSGLGDESFITTGGYTGVKNLVENITLEELLNYAQPPLKVQDLSERGALVNVAIFWNCQLGASCAPHYVIKRVDGGQGFTQKKSRRYKVGGVETRDALYRYGIRILAESSGRGRQTSAEGIVIQVGAGVALLRVAAFLVDFLMTSPLYSRHFREAYSKCRVQETMDYSDLQDRIDMIGNEKHSADADKKQATQSIGGGGALRVALGLGPAGRGGVGSMILRGRGKEGAAAARRGSEASEVDSYDSS